jgi:hypothetical protein
MQLRSPLRSGELRMDCFVAACRAMTGRASDGNERWGGGLYAVKSRLTLLPGYTAYRT